MKLGESRSTIDHFAGSWQPLLLVTSFGVVLFTPFLNYFLSSASALNFLMSALLLAAFTILFAARASRHGFKSGLVSKLSSINLIFILVLYFFALFKGNLDRSCYSIILVTSLMFMGQNFVGMATPNIEMFIQNSLFFLLKIFFFLGFVFIFVGMVRGLPYFQKLNIEMGLIIPIATSALILGVIRKSRIMYVLVSAMLSLTFLIHYQTSYLLIFAVVGLHLYRGSLFKLVKMSTLVIMFTYLILSIFTDTILKVLQYSANSGYDNTTVRVNFAQYALNYVREHFLFGGALTFPLTVTVKIGNSYSVLPLHSDALTFMIGIGAIGWGLHSIILILIANKVWHIDSSPLERALSGAIVSNFLAGIVNPQYGTNTYLFVMLLISVISLSNRTAPRLLTSEDIESR